MECVTVPFLSRTTTKYKYNWKLYLYKGAGNACAGQSNVRLSFILPVKDLELSVVGNFGRTLATGSDSNKDKVIYQKAKVQLNKFRNRP